ncbi:hypothetical protein GCM10017322_35900 [Paracoccus aerius]|nr:hypothetical protein GCM10017322_35900 [Paracoccus aerius]
MLRKAKPHPRWLRSVRLRLDPVAVDRRVQPRRVGLRRQRNHRPPDLRNRVRCGLEGAGRRDPPMLLALRRDRLEARGRALADATGLGSERELRFRARVAEAVEEQSDQGLD